MKKTGFKKILLRLVLVMLCLGFFGYGILVGKYELFPYSILKKIQDSSEKTLTNPIAQKNYSQKDLQNLLSVTPKSIDSIGNELKIEVFGNLGLPQLLPEKINKIDSDSYKDFKNLAEVEQFEITQAFNIKSIGHIFKPVKANNRLVIYHQGHGGHFLKGKNTIAFFVEKGFTVYAFSMPLKGPNNKPVIEVPKIGAIYMMNHEEFKYLKHPLKYFVQPVIAMLNYAEDKKFKDITMVGLSGGGWTTTLVAALDDRIGMSFPVAGTSPMFVRYQQAVDNYGDFEQTYTPLYTKINYMDLYVLGSVGRERKQIQILNDFDPCCFQGANAVKYADFISDQVSKHEFGEFKVIRDDTHEEHAISPFALDRIEKILQDKP